MHPYACCRIFYKRQDVKDFKYDENYSAIKIYLLGLKKETKWYEEAFWWVKYLANNVCFGGT